MDRKLTRRGFLKGAGAAGAGGYVGLHGGPGGHRVAAQAGMSTVFQVTKCPVPSGATHEHVGLDTLLLLLAEWGIKFYKTTRAHPWGGPGGLIDRTDVVAIKINCQWKFRGATNTDVLRGLIHRILDHPDGFAGEVVIFENGQGEGAFNGDPRAWGRYTSIGAPTGVHVNAEDDTLTVNRLVNEIFAGAPVTSFLLDPVRTAFLSSPDDHTTNGYRRVGDVSYPCFTTSRGTRVNLKDGIWTGSGYAPNLRFINLPVLKTHDGTGITGVLKHMYGVVSMADGSRDMRHYAQSGTQCGKMWTLVRMPDLNIVDCIWVNHQTHHCGWPPSTTHRYDVLLAGIDPVALDYYGSKHLLYPLGGNRQQYHNPDADTGLINHLHGARDTINAAGGIGGQPTVVGDANIRLISTDAILPMSVENWRAY